MGIAIVLFVSVLVFAIMQAMPGDPIDLMVDTRVSPERVAELKARWGSTSLLSSSIFTGWATYYREISARPFQ